jgi:DNA-binding transcriptional MerR regulator
MDELDDGMRNGLTIDELAEHVDAPVRTIRFYISEGLLPGPGSRGKSATYGDEHVIRLRLIRRLAEQRVPLTKIAELLRDLTLDEARALLAHEERQARELQAAEESGSPKDYVATLLREAQAARSLPTTPRKAKANFFGKSPRPSRASFDVQAPAPIPSAPAEAWRRWTLAPGVELHVRADALVRSRALIQRLLAAAGLAANFADDADNADD